MIPQAFTAIDDVRACEVRAADSYLAATSGGLVRVASGKVDHVWTVLDGLPDTKTNALLVEGAGGDELWIGTERGLAKAKLTNEALTVVHTYGVAPVRAIARASGVLYVATYGEGVLKLATADATTLTKVPFAVAQGPSARLRVTSLSVLGAELVAGTAGAGVWRLHDGALAALTTTPVVDLGSVMALAVRGERLYVGGVAGVSSFDKNGLFRAESKSDVRAFAAFGDALWGASYGEGALPIVKGAGEKTIAETLPEGAKWAQAIDASADGRCLGSAEGLFVAKPGASWAQIETKGMPSNDVNAIARGAEGTWIGTYDRGLALWSGNAWKTVGGLDDRINALAAHDHVVWVGTMRGLVRIEGEKRKTFAASTGLPSSDVHALVRLASGAMLVGTTKGAAIVEGDAVTPLGKKQGLVIDTAWAVAEGPGGALLVGASTGLYVRPPKQTKWLRYSVMSGQLADDWVTALAVHGNDIFVGTYSGGVARLSIGEGGVVASTTGKLGGGYVNLAGLTIGGDSLYAATMDGLLVRSLAGGDFGEWKKPAKAALGLDVTGVVAAPDGLWVASRRGLVHTK